MRQPVVCVFHPPMQGAPRLVSSTRSIGLLKLGLIAAAVLLQPAAPALTQTTAPIDTTIAPPPALRPHATLRRQVPPPIEDDTEDAVATPPPRPTVMDDESFDGQPDAAASQATPTPAVADGDLNAAEGTMAPLDGVIEIGETPAAEDGIADMRRDPRTREDIAAFQSPPAGWDPYLFQIEPEPLADRRIGELFRLEPYVARGVRIGSFVVFPEAEIGLITTNNVFRSSARQADNALDLKSNVRIVSDWRAHALEFRAGGEASFYDEFSSEDDRSYNVEARGRLDLTKRTNIEALVSHQRDKDSRSALDAPSAAAERGNIDIDRVAVALNHRFNRLSLQLRGSVTEVDYAPVPSIAGVVINNDDRDFTERMVAARASWQLNREVAVFAETALNDREFQVAAADGILRSSDGERYRLGVAFGPAGGTVRGEISAGWGQQRSKDGRLGDIDGVIVDANLAWRASALTTVLATARSEFIDTTAPGSPGALARQVGLEARHAIRKYLIGTAALRYTVAPYENIAITERELDTEIGLEYYLGRDVILSGRYQHVDFDSTAPGGGFTADIFRVGLKVRQ